MPRKAATPHGRGIGKRRYTKKRFTKKDMVSKYMEAPVYRGRNSYERSGELKWMDTPYTTLPFNAQASILCLNGVNTGASSFQRIGRSICLKSVHVVLNPTINLARSPGADGDNFLGRYILVWDQQANGAIPSYTDILQDIDNGGVPLTDTFSACMNLNNKKRFLILRDDKFVLPTWRLGVTGSTVKEIDCPPSSDSKLLTEWFVNLKGLETIFNALTNGDQRDITTGALYFVGVSSDDQVVPFNIWYVNLTSRIRYYDN